MTFQIYHQLGHNFKWNIDLLSEGVGNGVIIAPRSMKRIQVEKLPQSIKNEAIFDPQFFEPHYAKSSLGTYNFFPSVFANGFDTGAFNGTSALESAAACVAFQLSQNFSRIVIPTRYLAGMPSNYIEQQNHLFVNPFLEAIQNQNIVRPVILQLVLNAEMIIDNTYATQLLDWVTGLSELSGIYLIVHSSSSSKQIKDATYLYAVLRFIDALVNARMQVVLGYLNTEALLMTIANPAIVTVGSFENVRMFRVTNFQDIPGPPNGPVPRIYSGQLMQHISYSYRGPIMQASGAAIFENTEFLNVMFAPGFAWHFTKPEIYKHAIAVLCSQLVQLSAVDNADRFNIFDHWLDMAINHFGNISNGSIFLDSDSDGSHLLPWKTAANMFAQYKGW